MSKLLPEISIVSGSYVIHRLNPKSAAPEIPPESSFLAYVRTPEELSIVCDAKIIIASDRRETGWSLMKVEGPLEFSLVGILSRLAAVLAKAGISMFAVSTFDTDYILVKEKRLAEALQALKNSGYRIQNG